MTNLEIVNLDMSRFCFGNFAASGPVVSVISVAGGGGVLCLVLFSPQNLCYSPYPPITPARSKTGNLLKRE